MLTLVPLPPPAPVAIAPSIIPAERESGVWIVPVTLNGKPLKATVALETRWSTVDDKLPGIDASGTIELGGRPLAKVPFVREAMGSDTNGVSIILGADAFGDAMIGFDVYRNQIAIWPSGAKAEDAAAWFATGRVPSGVKARKPLTIPVGASGDGRLLLPIWFGEQRLTTLVSSRRGVSLFSKDKMPRGAFRILGSGKGGNGKGVATTSGRTSNSHLVTITSLEIAGSNPLLLIALLIKRETFASQHIPMDAEILVSDISPRQVAVDFPGRQIFVEAPSPDSDLERALAILFPIPLVVEGGRILIASEDRLSSLKGAKPLAGKEIAFFGKIPAEEVVAALSSRGEPAHRMAAAITESLRGDTYVLVKDGDEMVRFNLRRVG